MSGALLISSTNAWLREHPDELSDRMRVEHLQVTEVLRHSDLADTDLSDGGLALAAQLFPRNEQVALFRFFCHVRAWAFANNSTDVANASQEEQAAELVLDEVAAPRLPRVPASVLAGDVATQGQPRVPASVLAGELAESQPAPDATLATPTNAPALEHSISAPVATTTTERPLDNAPVATTTTERRLKTAAVASADGEASTTHPSLRCPHSAEELAAMPASRANVAALEFDLVIDTTWDHALSVIRDVSRLAGDPSWTVEEHAAADQVSLSYRSSATASPSIVAVASYGRGTDGKTISFRVVDVRRAGLRTLLSRRDLVRPARLLARRIAWGFLPA